MNDQFQILSSRGLTKTFVQGSEVISVLDSVDLSLQSGERVAIIGRSGSGKSTLLHLLAGLDDADQGTVAVFGETMTPASNEARTSLRRRFMGFVYQHHHLLPEFTALENVAMPLRLNGKSQSEARELCADLLQRVGLIDRLQHLPSELSGGERQRVAVARALIHEPKLVLADEPTGNLDSTTAAELMELMVELSENRDVAILVVTHDASMLHQFNRVLTLAEGRLVDA